MKKSTIVLGIALLLSFISCSKEEDISVQTVLKGHVSDTIRNVSIGGYKIVLAKSWRSCSNWMCGIASKEIATTYTDSNGNYSITFKDKLNPGESYGLQEQYYGIPYYPEYYSGSGAIVAGNVNRKDIYVWKPVELKLNVKILNNNAPPVIIRNEVANSDKTLFGTQNIYEQSVEKTYTLLSRPNSDINIIFWYYTSNNTVSVLHQKTFLYHTNFDDVNTLNYIIDCSSF